MVLPKGILPTIRYIFIVPENITLLPIVIVDKYACR